ncbi:MAG: class I SAM-dependent methyltransferase [Thiohalocapsa sp.]
MNNSKTPTSSLAKAPCIIPSHAQDRFVAKAKSMHLNPDSVWIGGYVDYEWHHLRPILEGFGIEVSGKRILEFGSNVGASAIVFRQLGARVNAVDVSANYVELARYNALRYGLSSIEFQHVADTRKLPFDSASIDLVSCNSVLEYVDPGHLQAVQREIDRVLRPGGLILVTGTSSRLWPREVHSQAWLVNYVPFALERMLPLKQQLTRGVWPWSIRRGFGPSYRNLDAEDGGRAFLKSRAAMSPPKGGPAHRFIAWIARLTNSGPGMWMNNISCILQKPSNERPKYPG